jgi:ABC-type amino acid transport substrate-binding protein
MKTIYTIIFISLVVIGVSISLFLNKKQTTAIKTQTSQVTTADTSLVTVQKRGKLIIGTYTNIVPMTYKDSSGNQIGYDIDLAKEIATQLGVTPEIKVMSFPDMFADVQTGDIDIIVSSITITPERSQEMLFSIPYFDGGQVIFTHKNNNSIKSIEDLKGKKIGILKQTTGEKAVNSLPFVSEITIVRYETSSGQIHEDAINGKIDAGVGDYVGVVGQLKTQPLLKIAGEPFTQEYYGVVTKLGNNTLIEEINTIIREMKRSGKLQQLKDKWLK